MEKIVFIESKKVKLAAKIDRFKVFVLEQHVSFKDEYDHSDYLYNHLYMYLNNRLVGYLRYRIIDDYINVGRVLIIKNYRNKGYGRQLIEYVDDIAIKNNIKLIKLNSQKQALDFYLKSNYIVDGQEFIEANIIHLPLIKYIK